MEYDNDSSNYTGEDNTTDSKDDITEDDLLDDFLEEIMADISSDNSDHTDIIEYFQQGVIEGNSLDIMSCIQENINNDISQDISADSTAFLTEDYTEGTSNDIIMNTTQKDTGVTSAIDTFDSVPNKLSLEIALKSLTQFEYEMVESLVWLSQVTNSTRRSEMEEPICIKYISEHDISEEAIFHYFYKSDDVSCFAVADCFNTIYISGMGDAISEVLVSVQEFNFD